MSLANHIEAARGDQTREEFAARMATGASATTVWRWETGRSIPRGVHARRLVKLGVPKAAIDDARAEAARATATDGQNPKVVA